MDPTSEIAAVRMKIDSYEDEAADLKTQLSAEQDPAERAGIRQQLGFIYGQMAKCRDEIVVLWGILREAAARTGHYHPVVAAWDVSAVDANAPPSGASFASIGQTNRTAGHNVVIQTWCFGPFAHCDETLASMPFEKLPLRRALDIAFSRFHSSCEISTRWELENGEVTLICTIIFCDSEEQATAEHIATAMQPFDAVALTDVKYRHAAPKLRTVHWAKSQAICEWMDLIQSNATTAYGG